MSLDFAQDYSNHDLLENVHRYKKLYKVVPVAATDLTTGDLVLVQSSCKQYGLFITVSDTDPNGTVHLSKFTDFDFVEDTDNKF